MSRRDGGKGADLAERIGSENWAALEDVIREVFSRAGPRVLQWRVAWGIEPLIGLVVLHTCIVTAREMRLGELAEEMLGPAGVAALGEIVDAARRLDAERNPPDEGAAELWARLESVGGDRSLRECARLAGLRFAVLFRVGQGRMPGGGDLAAIERWLAEFEHSTNTQEGTS